MQSKHFVKTAFTISVRITYDVTKVILRVRLQPNLPYLNYVNLIFIL